MEVSFNGAAFCVTGSCYHIKTDSGIEFLVDCGMFQGKEKDNNKLDFKFDPKKISFVLLTHAHIDHSGLIPKLYRKGFSGNVYCTDSTKDLINIMLIDSANIQNGKHYEDEPLYDHNDVKKANDSIISVDYEKLISIDGINVKFFDAGHILGSSHIEISVDNKILVFSGDIGQIDSPIVNNPTILENADYVFIESTYGNHNHEHKNERKALLEEVINITSNRGGKIIIPSFALERTQELLYYLHMLHKENKIKNINVYLDSPLAIKITKIFKQHREDYDTEALNENDPFSFPGLIITSDVKESMEINSVREPCIIISSSGMCTAGRILHHLKHNILYEKNTLLFVGYQAEGTRGRELVEKHETIKLFNRTYDVNLQIKSISGFSGHAGKNELIDWANNFKNNPKFFICHGEPMQADCFAQELKKEGKEVYIPKIFETVEL